MSNNTQDKILCGVVMALFVAVILGGVSMNGEQCAMAEANRQQDIRIEHTESLIEVFAAEMGDIKATGRVNTELLRSIDKRLERLESR